MCVSLPFLPPSKLEGAIDGLREFKFSGTSEADEKKMNDFKDNHLDYFEEFWIHGPFPVKTWNHYNKPRGLTNNMKMKNYLILNDDNKCKMKNYLII